MLIEKKILNLIVKIGLFTLIPSLGIVAALVTDETTGLTLANLSKVPIQSITTAAHDDALYVALTGDSQPSGVYRSNDNGHTWQHVSDKLDLNLSVLVLHPTKEGVLYGGTSGGPTATTNSLWLSQDRGETWHKIPLNLPADSNGQIPAVSALAVDPNQPDVLYVGTDGQGVYRFDADGYTPLGDILLSDAHVHSLAIGADGRVYVLTNNGLFISRHNNTWQKLESVPESPISLVIAPTEPQTLYAGGPSSGVYRSTDGGYTWKRVGGEWWPIPGAALRGTALVVDDQNAEHVVVATAYGVGNKLIGGSIYETYNAGRSWIKMADANGVVKQLVINKGTIYAVSENGLARYGELVELAPVASIHH